MQRSVCVYLAVLSLLLAGADQQSAWATTETVVFEATADTFVRRGASNTNEGASTFLRVRHAGYNRVLVRFDQDDLAALVSGDTLISAVLQLDIVHTNQRWSRHGRSVSIHRLVRDWTEGNGANAERPRDERKRGEGPGATWKCAIDTNIANRRSDCPDTAWKMTKPKPPHHQPWVELSTDEVVISNGQQGTVEWDVTADVAAFLSGTPNYGWLIKKVDERRRGSVYFAARESGLAPRLSLTIDSNTVPVVVPYVGGLSELEARAALETAGLTVGVVTESLSLSVPPGRVRLQNPVNGTEVPSGSAVDLDLSAPVPDGAVELPDSWAGQWAFLVKTHELASGELRETEEFADTICPGDSLGLILLTDPDVCIGTVTTTNLNVSCDIEVEQGLCTLAVQVQVNGVQTSDAFDGTAEVSVAGMGMCEPFVSAQGERLEISGTRLNLAPGACDGPLSSLTQKFGSLLLALE